MTTESACVPADADADVASVPPDEPKQEASPAPPSKPTIPAARRVRIGLVVRDRPELVVSSLDALRNAAVAAEVVLLLDGAEPSVAATLSRTGAQLLSLSPMGGGAACFNRLVTSADADVYVLLENGARGATGWLDRLLAALSSSANHGLAGPSTNVAWNAQRAFQRAGSTRFDIEEVGRAARDAFNGSWAGLEPLHSLSDFCYAVKREVVDAIGLADEGYGLGPCWELDYNVRAARAGFRGLWVRDAYVWRAPPSPRLRRVEESLFANAKRRYQDHFCGRRLRGEKHDYEAHCKGEECPDFAPAGLIPLRIARPGSVAEPRYEERAAATPSVVPPAKEAAEPEPLLPSCRASSLEVPPVSCIMPTFNRRAFARLAAQRFLEQDYPNKELIIVDDGSHAVEDLSAMSPKVSVVRLTKRHSTGNKRNLACERAAGVVIMQWDDDDWYGPSRISRQAEPILSGKALLSGLTGDVVMSLPSGDFWEISPALHERLYFGNVHGGTLAFARSVWEAGVRYPDQSHAEDAAFLRAALARELRLVRVENTGLFAYARHQHNAWRIEVGRYLDPRGWTRVPAPPHIPVEVLDAYRDGARQLGRARAGA